MQRIIAVDCGAESGRVIVGTIADGRIALDVIHRFPNGPVNIDGTLRWDLPALFAEIKRGLAEAFKRHGGEILSIGVDTWGVDYALLDPAGALLELPYNYRDRRTNGVPEHVHAKLAEGVIFKRTGVKALQINTLYQLVAQRSQHPERLAAAAHLLTIPDLLHYWLSGEMRTEWSFAGTTQLAVAGKPEWDAELINRLGLPGHLFRPIVHPGTKLGRLRPELASELGLAGERPWIVLPASHDTASAVAASPGDPLTTAYLSSGTWSLMGVVLPQAVTSEAACAAGLSNEIGAFPQHGGAVRLNQNIMGLWLVQECRRGFARAGREYSYAQLADLAAAAPSSGTILDVDDARFLQPGEGDDTMPARILRQLRERGIAWPHGTASAADDGALVRLVLDGLAAAYGRCARELRALSGRAIEAVHVIGGGSQHRLLCQLTADACRLPVVAGPVEATALGNVLVQALGLGLIASPAEGRELVRASVTLETFKPKPEEARPAAG
jgi:rhamnulokinase